MEGKKENSPHLPEREECSGGDLACPKCGAIMKTGDNYCDQCGAKLIVKAVDVFWIGVGCFIGSILARLIFY